MKVLVLNVWILIVLHTENQGIWIIRNMSKISLKIGFAAVTSVETS